MSFGFLGWKAARNEGSRAGRRGGAYLLAGILACGFLGTAAAHPAAAASFSPDQQQQIRKIVHDYLLHHPEVLVESLREAQRRARHAARTKAAQALRARHAEVFDDPETPVGGNRKGDVSLVEFFDYQCPYCKAVQPALDKLMADDHRLRFVYKEMPVLGPVSLVAARAALAARNQGKYLAFHAKMMEAKGRITDDRVFAVARSVGLDIGRLKRDMASPAIEKALKANLDLAQALNITGTPGFVIGRQIVDGAVDIATLKRLVADARATTARRP